jgi:hypothetical protein
LDANCNEQWNKTFGGIDYDMINDVHQTMDGGYILTGLTKSSKAGSHDALLIKTDEDGNQQWSKTFGGTRDDEASSVLQTSDGSYVLAGHNGDRSDAWLIKTDANGNEQWNRTFGGPRGDEASSIQQTMDGGYVLAIIAGYYGFVDPDANTMSDIWLLKTDANGDEQWTKKFGDAGKDYVYSVLQTSDGGYMIAGDTESYRTGDTDAWLIKVGINSDAINPSDEVAYDTKKLHEKSVEGFAILGSMFSIIIIFLLKKKRP